MITLITGVPGSGKTAFALNEMLELTKIGNRPIFVHGIPELRLPHEPVRCESINCDVCHRLPDTVLLASQWHNWAPDGAILFFDETQNIFRPRASTAQVPESVATLEVHRHRGLDFYLITQHPNLIDTNVRRLVSRHVHLAGTWARRISYEWGEVSANVQSTTNAVKSTYMIPKQVFPLYRSATIHTRLNRKRPLMLYVLPIICLLIALLAYRIYHTRINPSIEQTNTNAQTTPTTNPIPGYGPASSEQDLKQRFDFIPTVLNHPESAPAYQQIAKVTEFPQLKGCIKSKNRCTCYTQQATEYLVTKLECEDLVKAARFNPYRQPQQESAQVTAKRSSVPEQPKPIHVHLDQMNTIPAPVSVSSASVYPNTSQSVFDGSYSDSD